MLVTVCASTHDEVVVGSTLGRLAIKWWVTTWMGDCGQVNYLGI